VCLTSTTLAQDPSSASVAEIGGPHIQHQLQHVLDHAISHSGPNPGAALLAVSKLKVEDEGDQQITALVVGTHSQSDDAPVFPDTPFGVASITKIMVAALTFIYSERGLVDLDTPILGLADDDGWLLDHVSNPRFRQNLESLTLRDLLAHRSGLPDYWEDEAFLATWLKATNKKWSPTELIDWAGQQDPVCAPRSCFQYADTNYVIIGLALERLTGWELREQLRTEIFEPLQMRCSWMFFEEPVPEGCAAPTHSYEADLDVTDNRMQSADWSGGGVYSTLDDQLKLLRGIFDGDLISRPSLAEMQRWGESDLGEEIVYGLGLYKTSAGSDITLVGHTGIHNAFSFLWVEAGVLITGSINQSENKALTELVFPAIRVLRDRGGYVDHTH
jgi:D-alanyl-D-alanine carboxypeptidase